MSTLTWENPCEPSISRNFVELDSNASRVTALWLESQTCACPPCRAMRTSMGPSAGGLTCSLALVRLPSIITDTLSATPCPNPAVSTPAATLNIGKGPLSVVVFEVSSCAAPVLPSFDAPDKDKSGLLACERLSTAPASAALETSCAILPAVAAVTAADVAAAACAKAAAGPPAAASFAAATPCSTVSAPAESIEDEEISGEGALVPCTIAAAMTAWPGAAVAAGPLSVGSFAALASVWGNAGAVALRFAAPSLAWGSRALPWAAADMRVPADGAAEIGAAEVGAADVVAAEVAAADASVRILAACATLEPELGTATELAALPRASALAAEAGASPPGTESAAAASSNLGANAAAPPAVPGRLGAARIAPGSAPAAPLGESVMAPAASAA